MKAVNETRVKKIEGYKGYHAVLLKTRTKKLPPWYKSHAAGILSPSVVLPRLVHTPPGREQSKAGRDVLLPILFVTRDHGCPSYCVA